MKTVYRSFLFLFIPFHFCCAQSGGSSISEKTDYGRLFVEAVNSDSEPKQKDIIRRIFSESALSNTGVDRLLELVKHQAYGHGGTSKGVNFEFRYFPAEDITLVVFCNQDNGAYDDLKRNAMKLISGER